MLRLSSPVRSSLLAGLFAAISATDAQAVVIASDTFETADHPTGDRTLVTGGGSGLSFFRRFGTTNSSIITDATFASKALSISDADSSSSTSGLVIGVLPATITLNNVNDTMSLSFQVRFTDVAAAGDIASNLRFGFYSSVGTSVTADDSTLSDNDTGYASVMGSGPTVPAANSSLFSENGSVSPVLGGTDRGFLTSAAGFTLNNNLSHSVLFSVTRTSPTDMTLSLQVDGGTAITGTTATIRTSFDEIAFSTGFSSTNAVTFVVDNVNVTATVPEPSSALLLASSAAMCFGFRRRRHGSELQRD